MEYNLREIVSNRWHPRRKRRTSHLKIKYAGDGATFQGSLLGTVTVYRCKWTSNVRVFWFFACVLYVLTHATKNVVDRVTGGKVFSVESKLSLIVVSKSSKYIRIGTCVLMVDREGGWGFGLSKGSESDIVREGADQTFQLDICCHLPIWT